MRLEPGLGPARFMQRRIQQEGLDGGLFIIGGEFVAHDSRLQVRSLNPSQDAIIKLQKPVGADANTLILLLLRHCEHG
jgi:hypothetical protein